MTPPIAGYEPKIYIQDRSGSQQDQVDDKPLTEILFLKDLKKLRII